MFELVVYRHNWGEDRVYFHDQDGKLASVPASWTDFVAEDLSFAKTPSAF
jgi:Family of unknown function (DUF5372)